MLLVGKGRSRNRKSISGPPHDEFQDHSFIGNVELDYCQSCRNDFRKFHAEGGGDPSDIAREADE